MICLTEVVVGSAEGEKQCSARYPIRTTCPLSVVPQPTPSLAKRRQRKNSERPLFSSSATAAAALQARWFLAATALAAAVCALLGDGYRTIIEFDPIIEFDTMIGF